MMHGWPRLIQGMDKPFWRRKEESSCEFGIVMWLQRIVIPKALRCHTLSLLHEGHPIIPGGCGCKKQMDRSVEISELEYIEVSDNGLQFASSMFHEWSTKLGIYHAKASLYHPQTNGLAERFIGTLKMVLKHGNNRADTQLNQFLLCCRNMTHPSTGKSPAEIMIGRRLPNVLDNI
ncbi:hypothetical protein GJ496_011357 [Pomphorhynchus laevis]|nr:hypothetical protein GJ496_011357 [Pomphorhynchus laevis]